MHEACKFVFGRSESTDTSHFELAGLRSVLHRELSLLHWSKVASLTLLSADTDVNISRQVIKLL
jgi:hypothetical protein